MAHIRLPEGIPGILGPMAFSPETAKPLNALAEVLLRGPNSLSAADREMIATYVSSQNDCYFCQHAHGAVAAYRLGGDEKLVNDGKLNFEAAAISDKMKALLAIAGKVQRGGKQVTAEDVTAPASTMLLTKRSTMLSLSRLLSACTTVTCTNSRRRRPPTPIYIAKMEDGLPTKATSSRPRTYLPRRKSGPSPPRTLARRPPGRTSLH